jgi:hypothetical protein
MAKKKNPILTSEINRMDQDIFNKNLNKLLKQIKNKVKDGNKKSNENT